MMDSMPRRSQRRSPARTDKSTSGHAVSSDGHKVGTSDGAGKQKRRRAPAESKRLSFSFESPPAELRSILARQRRDHRHGKGSMLKKKSKDGKRSKPQQQLLFNLSRTNVVDITPLADKSQGRVRMPRSPDGEATVEATSRRSELDAEANVIELSDGSDENSDVENGVGGYSVMNVVEDEVGNRGGTTNADATSQHQLWTAQLNPSTREELLALHHHSSNSSIVEEVYGWFNAWHKRLKSTINRDAVETPSSSKSKGKTVKTAKRKGKKRRREQDTDESSSSGSSSGENDEADWDNDFTLDVGVSSSRASIGNPLIIHGPTASGKTSLAHCAAKECGFRVIELSASEGRSGARLRERVSGAVGNHYVGVKKGGRCQQDIRNMLFSPRADSVNSSNDTATCNSREFSAILVDDCDVVFPAADEGFWPALKELCEEARIPIVLTCTNFSQLVQPHLGRWAADSAHNGPDQLAEGGSSASIAYKLVEMNAPDDEQLAECLSNLAGLKGLFIKEDLVNSQDVTKSRGGDIRAVINQLHFEASTLLPRTKRGNPQDGELKVTTTIQQYLSLVSALDAAYGPLQNADGTMPNWRNPSSHLVPDWGALEAIDQNHHLPDPAPYYDFNRFDKAMTEREMAWSALIPPAEPPFPDPNPIKACIDAVRRTPRKRYSTRETATDYLPCLLAIHEGHLERTRVERSLSFRSGRTRHRRIQHPFDAVEQLTGMAIDSSQRLKGSINGYALGRGEQQ